MLKSPFLERLEEEGLEVILFTDAIDEYMMQHLSEYDDRKLINISKDNLKLGGKDKDEKAADKALKVTGTSKIVLGPALPCPGCSIALVTVPAEPSGRYAGCANLGPGRTSVLQSSSCLACCKATRRSACHAEAQKLELPGVSRAL